MASNRDIHSNSREQQLSDEVLTEEETKRVDAIEAKLYQLLEAMAYDLVKELPFADDEHFILYNGEMNTIKFLARTFFEDSKLHKNLEELYKELDAVQVENCTRTDYC